MRRFHEMPAEEFARLDIGEVNLECADKLPGSENLNIPRYVAVLDEWAKEVADTTDRSWHKFKSKPRKTKCLKHKTKAAQFRMLVLVTVLQRDIGIHYAVGTLEDAFDATDSRLHFIHGIIETSEGTCANLPVLFIAIGRRLGYPLKLVQGVEHLFIRWDDPKTGVRFNIETTCQGLMIHSDEHYHTWPKPANMEHVRDGWLLKSMTPREELSVFYFLRARCFLDWMEFSKALELAYHSTHLGGGEENPYCSGLHSTLTLMHRADSNLMKYGFKPNGEGVVLEVEVGNQRPMRAWEKWALEAAEDELKRIEQLHVARRQQGKSHVRNKRIMQLADGPNAAIDAFFETEVTA